MKIIRRKAKIIKIGRIRIGGNYPIAIQSMAKVKTSQSQAVIRQIEVLENYGCEIVRLAVMDKADAAAIKKIKAATKMPLVADIHFDWQLAIAAIEAGIDKIRLNPGNIYKKEQVKEVVRAAKLNRIPIRVGLNSGSLPAAKGGIPEKMVRACLDYIKVIEGCGFSDIVISLKGSGILDTIEAYRKIAKSCSYPLHLGVTATGFPAAGVVKSSIALGALLLEGIGDTVRVSLTDQPQEEVKAAKSILEALSLRKFGPQIISCPTCGRCKVDLVKVVKELERRLSALSCELSTRPMQLAVMGCVVNGPGEAKQADIGIAFGSKDGLLFKKGRPIKKVSYSKCIEVLLKEMRR